MPLAHVMFDGTSECNPGWGRADSKGLKIQCSLMHFTASAVPQMIADR